MRPLYLGAVLMYRLQTWAHKAYEAKEANLCQSCRLTLLMFICNEWTTAYLSNGVVVKTLEPSWLLEDMPGLVIAAPTMARIAFLVLSNDVGHIERRSDKDQVRQEEDAEASIYELLK